MKIGSFLKIQDKNDYKKVNLKIYQQLIDKFIHLFCKSRLDMLFIVEKLSKPNTNLRI